MEAVDDARRYPEHADTVWPTAPRHNLPAVETSRNSNSNNNDAIEGPRQGLPAPPGRRDLSFPGSGSRSDLSILLNEVEDTQRGGSIVPRRPSFSHGRMAATRPSLPSLKTVLGDAMTSPPKTPSPQTAFSRQSPARSSLEFRPAEAYPHKKQRTESFDHYRRPYSAEAASATPLEPVYIPHSTKYDPGFNAFDARPERNDDYRNSLPPLPTPGSATSRTSMQSFPPLQRTSSSSDKRSSIEESGIPRRTPDEASATVREPSFSSNHVPREQGQGAIVLDIRERAAHERIASQYAMTSEYNPHSPRAQQHDPSGFRPNGEAWYPNPTQEGTLHPHDARRFDGPSQSPTQHSEGYLSFPYEAHASSVFMSGHYGSAHAKQRKRSNLPKQSTEIMKKWFDRNITNPYPSEEQKAIFAQATGISLTQVSNWFINHRRRCPELRDKREKGRPDNETDEQD